MVWIRIEFYIIFHIIYINKLANLKTCSLSLAHRGNAVVKLIKVRNMQIQVQGAQNILCMKSKNILEEMRSDRSLGWEIYSRAVGRLAGKHFLVTTNLSRVLARIKWIGQTMSSYFWHKCCCNCARECVLENNLSCCFYILMFLTCINISFCWMKMQVMKHLRKMLINTMIMRKMMETLAGHFQEGSSDTEWEDGRQSVSVTATNNTTSLNM